MSIWNSLEDAKTFLEKSSSQEINKHFTRMVTECRGSEGCGKESKKIIEHLHKSGAQCLPEINGINIIARAYQDYARIQDLEVMERLCSNLNLNKLEAKGSGSFFSSVESLELSNINIRYNGDIDPVTYLSALAKSLFEPASDGSIGIHNLDEKIIQEKIDNYMGEGSGKVVLNYVNYAYNLITPAVNYLFGNVPEYNEF